MAKHFQVDRNKNKNSTDSLKKGSYRPKKETMTKSEKLMEGVDIWTSFYRANPHRFAKDYLGLHLKLFQCILLVMMMWNNYFMYLAARGQGKSWLISVFCIVRCILFPESKIIVAAGQKSQAQEVLVYIDMLRKDCANLDREIESIKPTSSTDPTCNFHNGSWIRVVAANQGARSKRCQILLVDEFRMVDLDILNKVLRRFATAPRQPKYLRKPEYAHLQERNKELYLSSCWYQSHWSWDKVKAFFNKFKKGESYFVCGLPYQLAIKENLLMREQVMDEMSEDDFDATSWEIEMGCKFFGESESAYFKFDSLDKIRTMSMPVYPKDVYQLLKDKSFKPPEKKQSEIRFISNDIAMIGRDQNDASAYVVFSLIPNRNNTFYNIRVMYLESIVGGHTETQAIRIRQLYDDFDCNYIVLDTRNAGIGIYDALVKKLTDKERGVEYSPFACMNDKVLEDRCLDSDAPRNIYSITGSVTLNDQCARKTKDEIMKGRVELLLNHNDAKLFLKDLKGYENLSIEDKVKLEFPYIQTTALINEMVNLSNVGLDGVIKLKEPRSGRKDRYSAFSYGIYFVSILTQMFLNTEDAESDSEDYECVFY